MKITEITANNCVDEVVRSLRLGNLCVFPCDTIYGIIGRAPDTAGKIAFIKKRPEEKRFLKLVRPEMIPAITPQNIDPEITELWPAPFTIIVNDYSEGSEAIRVPENTKLLEMITLLDSPLFSTSVNISGEHHFTQVDEMVRYFGDTIDIYVSGTIDEESLPSTILDIRKKPYYVVRQGSYVFSPRILSS